MSAPVMTPARTPPGRHHRRSTPRERTRRALDVVSRVGSLVSLAALLVLGGAVGGLVDGAPADTTTVRATFGHP